MFSIGDKHKPVNIVKAAIEHADKNNNNLLIIDTAGRLHIDEDMMNELIEIKDNISVHQTILVVDSMTGQDAVNVSQMFNEKIGIDGVILTKLMVTLEVVLPYQFVQLQVDLYFMLVWEKNYLI